MEQEANIKVDVSEQDYIRNFRDKKAVNLESDIVPELFRYL